MALTMVKMSPLKFDPGMGTTIEWEIYLVLGMVGTLEEGIV